jgi:integrase
MLTDLDIRKCKPTDKVQRLSDEKALYLLINPDGSRYWRWDYLFDGRRKTISFGTYPIVTLKRAREKQLEAQRVLDHGLDPSVERRKAKIAAKGDTFRTVADEYMVKLKKEIGLGTWGKKQSHLDTYLYPRVGSLSVSRITSRDVLDVLQPIDVTGKHETARRVRQLVGEVFTFAIATSRAVSDPSLRLTKALTRVTTTHHAALTDELEIGRLLRDLSSYTASPVVTCALNLAPLVFLRPFELRKAEWREVEFDNPHGPMWRIPVSRMKKTQNAIRVDHLVPLAPQAVKILRRLHALTGHGRLVFPGPRHTEKPISDMTLTAALRTLGYNRKQQSVHGFRTIGSTRCREIGFDGDLVELQLAHKIANPVRAAYDRAARVPERVRMMHAYANHLDELRARADVVDSRRTG